MVDETRRDVLKGVGTLLTGTAVAGCSADNGDDNGYEDDDNDDNGGNGDEGEGELTYELNIRKITDADYTQLEFTPGQQFTLDALRAEQDHGQLEYTITEYLDGKRNGNIDPNQVTDIEVELDKYDDTFSLDELEQLEQTGILNDQTLQIGYQELLNGQNTVNITATLENGETYTAETTIHKKDSQHEHQQLRKEYRHEILDSPLVNWKNWVDTNIDDMKVEEDTDSQYPYMQRQIGMIASEWVGEVTKHTKPSLRAEQLGITLEYAFQEHLNIELEAGQISNNHLRGGTHHTVIARNTETENIWHVDTGGGTTGEPERISGDGGIYRMSLDWGHYHTEERHYAETLATAFTRTQNLGPDLREQLIHTDEALEHIVTLKRENNDYSTVEEQTRNAALLAHHYPDQQFQIDKNEIGETELAITTQ